MKTYKTFFKQKWIFFALSLISYFLPFIIVTACLLPLTKAATGTKWAIGIVVVLINAVPFLMGALRMFFSHFPMANILALVFIALAAFFRLDFFQYYAEIFIWIELAALLGSVLACVFWAQFRKYSQWRESVKANVKSGAFQMKEGGAE